MDRIRFRALLESYQTTFEEERDFLPDFIQLTQDPVSFKRERKSGHFTASSWIINKERTHTLLTLHRRLNRWLQLGGHADGNENLMEVAMEEAREESGLQSLRLLVPAIFDIDKHLIPANATVAQHYHYDTRILIEADLHEPLTISSESLDLAWVPLSAVATTVGHNPSILRMLKKTGNSTVNS